MRDFVGSVSPKGQVTIPQEMREKLGIKPRDRVIFSLDEGGLRITSLRSRLDAAYQSVPALDPPRAWGEVTAIAHEEHAQNLVKKWRDQ